MDCHKALILSTAPVCDASLIPPVECLFGLVILARGCGCHVNIFSNSIYFELKQVGARGSRDQMD